MKVVTWADLVHHVPDDGDGLEVLGVELLDDLRVELALGNPDELACLPGLGEPVELGVLV